MSDTGWKILAVIGVLIAIAAGMQYQASERRAQQAEQVAQDAMRRAQQAELAAQEAERAARQSAQLGQLVDQAKAESEALKSAIEDSQKQAREQTARAIRGARLAEGLSASMGARTAMLEAYQTNGKWPLNNREAGLAAPEGFQQHALQSVTVVPGGGLRLAYLDDQGKAGHLLMQARMNAAGNATWQCSSPDIEDINTLITACTYQPVTR